MMKKSENYSNVSELELEIDSELQLFLDTELGLDQSLYEFDTALTCIDGRFKYRYDAMIRLLDEDAEDFLEEFTDNADEIYAHLSFKFPGVRFELTVEAGDVQVKAAEASEDDELDIESDGDPDTDENEDSVEQQYTEEGMTIVDDIEATSAQVYERGEEDEDEDENEDEDEKPMRRKHKSDVNDELDEIDLEDEDDYVPDDEDREELWKAFGDFEDAHNLRQYQITGGVDTHDLQGVNLLCHPHGANLRGDVRTNLSRQDQTHDRTGELQQHDLTGGVARDPAGHPWTLDVQLHLNTDDSTDEEGYQQYNTYGVDA